MYHSIKTTYQGNYQFNQQQCMSKPQNIYAPMFKQIIQVFPPKIDAENHEHLRFIQQLKNKQQLLGKSEIILYLLSMLEYKKLNKDTLSLLLKCMQKSYLAIHQINYLKQSIKINYPSNIDYVYEYQKIMIANKYQVPYFLQICEILSLFSFDFNEYVERKVNQLDVLSVVLNNQQVFTHLNYQPILSIQAIVYKLEKMNHELSQINHQISEYKYKKRLQILDNTKIYNKLYRIYYSLLTNSSQDPNIQNITRNNLNMICQILQTLQIKQEQLSENIQKHLIYGLQLVNSQIIKKIQYADSSESTNTFIRLINNQFCYKVLKILQNRDWKCNHFLKIFRFLSDIELITNIDNSEAIQYGQQLYKQAKKRQTKNVRNRAQIYNDYW